MQDAIWCKLSYEMKQIDSKIILGITSFICYFAGQFFFFRCHTSFRAALLLRHNELWIAICIHVLFLATYDQLKCYEKFCWT